MSGDKTCLNCGAALMPGDVFCGECGARVRAPAYDAPPDAPPDVSPAVVKEPPAEEPVLTVEPSAGDYIPPPPVKEKSDGDTVLRVVAIVIAVSFLLVSLCLCGIGALALIPSEENTFAEMLGPSTFLCFAPGGVVGLLGIGAAYFGLRKRVVTPLSVGGSYEAPRRW